MTCDFSLSSPRPLTGKLDPNVFSWQDETRTPDDVALVAWLDAQHASLDVDDIALALDELQERLNNGERWIAINGTDHPRYQDAYRLKRELEDRKGALLIQYRTALYDCWTKVMTTYAAIQHIPDRAGWIRDNASSRFTAEHPYDIWRALRGRQAAPGAWRPEQSEAWVERRVETLEWWNVDDLRERLHERMATR